MAEEKAICSLYYYYSTLPCSGGEHIAEEEICSFYYYYNRLP